MMMAKGASLWLLLLLMEVGNVSAAAAIGFGSGSRDTYSGDYLNKESDGVQYGQIGRGGKSRIMNFVNQAVSLQPPVLDKSIVRDKQLIKHLKKHMDVPLVLRCYSRTVYEEAEDGKKKTTGFLCTAKKVMNRRQLTLRKFKDDTPMTSDIPYKAYWREGKYDQTGTATEYIQRRGLLDGDGFFAEQSYDIALEANTCPVAEFEVILPPMSKRSSKNVHVVYTCIVAKSKNDWRSLVPKNVATVAIYPKGRTDTGRDEVYSNAGAGLVNTAMKNGIVDPSWGILRKPYFRKGRNSAGVI